MSARTETICLLRRGSGFDLNRYVTRVFRTADDAHRFAARQTSTVSIARVGRKVRSGDAIPPTERTRSL